MMTGSDCCLVGIVFPFRVINTFWNKIMVMVGHIVNVSNTTEFIPLNV